MSTTIYNGYIFDGNLNSFLEKVKESNLYAKTQEATSALIKRKIAHWLSCSFIDMQGNDEDIPLDLFREMARNKYTSIMVEKRRSSWDFEATIMVKPHPLKKNKLLVGEFVVHPEVRSLVIETLDLKAYGYWDNSDPEEGVTSLEWKQRRSAWNVALGSSSWVEAGFLLLQLCSTQILDDFELFYRTEEKEFLEIFQESYTKAVEQVANHNLVEHLLEGMFAKNRTYGEFINDRQELLHFLRTEEKAAEFFKLYCQGLSLCFPQINRESLQYAKRAPWKTLGELKVRYLDPIGHLWTKRSMDYTLKQDAN